MLRRTLELVNAGRRGPCFGFSDILFFVQRFLFLIHLGSSLLFFAATGETFSQEPPTKSTPLSGAQATSKPTQAGISTVVLDPAHGGSDAGARGSSGVIESDVVLTFARLLRAELERQGLRVILTRQGNDNPSFDDRAATANGQRNAVFVSLHVSSTGPVGTARAYSVPQTTTTETKPTTERPALLRWDEAQEPFAGLSRRLAELVQIQLAQKFRGSPEVPAESAVHQLKTIAAPAIAIEISSVSVPDRAPLDQMAQPLAEAVARGVAAFRSLNGMGAR